MELAQLRYFQALAKNGNLTRTAKDLFISAPALSTSISRLEQEVGVPLFDRVRGRMYLNEYGETFLREVVEGLSKLDAGREMVRAMSQLEDTHLSLVVLNNVLWNGLIADFMAQHPDVHVTVLSSSSNALKKDVNVSNFDLFLGGNIRVNGQDLESASLFVDNSVMVCLPSDHPLAARESLRMPDLKDERFIFPSPNYKLSEFYYRICREAGFEPTVVAECNYVLSSYLIQRGFGITFTSLRACEFDIFSNSVTLPLVDVVNDTALAQNIYWKKQQKLSKPAAQFRDFAIAYYNKNVKSSDPFR